MGKRDPLVMEKLYFIIELLFIHQSHDLLNEPKAYLYLRNPRISIKKIIGPGIECRLQKSKKMLIQESAN